MTGIEIWNLVAPILYENLIAYATDPEKQFGMNAYLHTYLALKEYDGKRKDGEK